MSGRRIYLLHFERPFSHAAHYLGSTDNLETRLAEHIAGRGARLMAAITAAGISFVTADVWRGSRTEERRLKRRGGHARLCAICRKARGLRRYRARRV